MLKKIIKQFSFILVLVVLLILPFFVSAQINSNSGIVNRLERTGKSAGFSDASQTSLAENVGSIVNVALSFLGIVFIVLTIIGGYQWMTAGGNEEEVKKAKNRIKNAVIGLIIVASAFAIWNLVERYFLEGTNRTNQETPVNSGGGEVVDDPWT